jgi:hypothetical protein
MLARNHRNNDSILQYKKNVEAGLLEGKIVKSKNKAVPDGFMEKLGMDPENTDLAETLFNQTRKDAFTTDTGRLRGWENGVPFEIEVPKDIYDLFTTLPETQFTTLERAISKATRMLSQSVVLEPFKYVSIVGRDAMNSLIYSKTGWKPSSLYRSFLDVRNNSLDYQKFKALGGEQYSARLMSRMDRIESLDKMLKLESPNVIIRKLKDIPKIMKQFGDDLSISVPFAEYQRSIKKFGDTPQGRLKALIEAKSVTYDPTTRGSNRFVKGWVNIAPFANPMLQEPGMIARNIKRPAFWVKGTMAYGVTQLLSE